MTLTLNHYKSFANKFIGGGIKPIIKNPVFFIFQAIIIGAPAWAYWITQYSSYIRLYALLAAPIIIFAAYITTAIIHFYPKLKGLLYATSYILSILEVYLILFFNTRFSSLILQLIFETTPDEANGFISAYLLTPKVAFYLLFLITFIGINIFAEHSKGVKSVIDKFCVKISNYIYYLAIFCLLIFGTIYAYRDIRFSTCLLFSDYAEVLTKLKNYTYGDNYTTLGKIIFSSYSYYSTLNETDILAETLSNISGVNPNFTSKNIVFILGESHNKYHSSLYGYNWETTSNLNKEKDNLYVMTDVVSPHNATAKCLRKLFSFSSQDNNLYWAKTPLFPALYKAAGYNVTFFSNQECIEADSNPWNFINNSFISPETIPYLYDNLNATMHQFDEQLVEEYISIAHTIPAEQAKLTIFHLQGQHVGYEERYPESETVFTKEDYQHRTDLNEKQKEIVAQYDNATLYNDKVIASIIDIFRNEDAIIIYLSDHSDEVCDYRDHFGRSHEPIIAKGRAMHQYEVPFMIWVSDKYKEAHPDIIKRIENSVNRPFMTDDLPHLMLDLAGIECEWFEPSRSLINDQYNVNRKRLLEDSKQDYDEIMKSATLN